MVSADLVIRNARIWTGDPARPWADCAVADNGRFVFVGRERDANLPASARTIDAARRLVVPGLVDAHVHLLGTGEAMRSVNLKGVAELAEMQRRVAVRVRATPPGEWITGAGWDQNDLPGRVFPDRYALDAVAPDNPVSLSHTSGHCTWLNSAALAAAGITADTPSPDGGTIDLGDDGEPSGILRDNAMGLGFAAMPPASANEGLTALREAINHAHRLGLTGVHAMNVSGGEYDALRHLHETGELTLRTRIYFTAWSLERWAEYRTGDGDGVLEIGGVKFFADGALGSLTAWMLEPFAGTDDTGLALQSVAELEEWVRWCFTHGLAPAIHAIGDRANAEVLDLLERTRGLAPDLPRRIEHAQLLAPGDVERFAALGVAASVQPIHGTQDYEKVDRSWGKRGRMAYAFRSLLDAGVTLAFGSDTPVETMDPLAGIHAAVTRQRANGEPEGGWYPDERVTVGEALRAYTAGPALAGGLPEGDGIIAAGEHADCVMLSRDLFALDDPMAITGVHALLTVVAGRVVYEDLATIAVDLA